MKLSKPALAIFVIGFFLALPTMTGAQDAEKQKLIDIEKAIAAAPNPGPDAVQVTKQDIFDGPITQLTSWGKATTFQKSQLVQLVASPDPADPGSKVAITVSDFHVDLYGDTALVRYRQTSVFSGSKETVLNGKVDFTCLDTFVKRNGQWLFIGGAASSRAPLSQAAWDALNREISQEPKDIQQAYH